MSNRHVTPRRAAAISAVVFAVVLIIVAAGYPDWLWLPLTISSWLAILTMVVVAALEIRARFRRT